MRWVWIVLGAAAVLAGGYHLLGFAGEVTGPRFTTVAVDRGPIAATVTATGTVNPVAAVAIGSYVSGPVQAIFVDYNSVIHKGELLARIDPRPFQAKVEAAEADLATAHARVAKSRADLTLRSATRRRQHALAATGVASRNDLDIADSDARQAEAQVALDQAALRQTEAHLSEARVNLAYTDIVSPIDGIVVARSVSVGQTVAATFQTPTLFQVAGDLTRMAVDASVSESDIGQVEQGQAVAFTVDAYPGQPFRGTVTQVRNAPLTVQNVVTYSVMISVPNTDLKLKPGMTANVTITTASRTDALRVPTGALRFRPPGSPPPTDGPGAWRQSPDGTPERVLVTTGVADDRYTEILTGVAPGELVITGIEKDSSTAGGGPSRGPTFTPGSRRGH